MGHFALRIAKILIPSTFARADVDMPVAMDGYSGKDTLPMKKLRLKIKSLYSTKRYLKWFKCKYRPARGSEGK